MQLLFADVFAGVAIYSLLIMVILLSGSADYSSLDAC